MKNHTVQETERLCLAIEPLDKGLAFEVIKEVFYTWNITEETSMKVAELLAPTRKEGCCSSMEYSCNGCPTSGMKKTTVAKSETNDNDLYIFPEGVDRNTMPTI